MFQIGSSLHEERLRQGLELELVERETRIRVHQLRALEEENFEELPYGVYRRSFLREYANFLGLDGDAYAREYSDRFEQPEPEPVHEPQRRPRRLRPAWIGAVAVLALAGVAVWALDRDGSPHTAAPPAPATHVAGASTTRLTPPAPKPHVARPAALVLTAARGNCWLRVRSGSTTVYEGTLAQGGSVRFGLGRPLHIRIGAPWNLDARLGGKAVTLPSQTGDVVATSGGIR